MKRKVIFILFSALLMLCLSAFQCSSTELTSAKLYIQQKNYPKAIEALKKEVEKNPQSDEGYYLLGVIYGEQGEFKDMVEALNKSLTISKKFEKDIIDAKKSYWTLAFNKGVGFFNKASRTTSQDSIKMYRQKAIDSFNAAILIQPDSADNYKNLAFAYLQAGQNDESIEPLKKLIALEKSADSYRILGQIYSQKGIAAQTKYKSTKNVADSLAALDAFNTTINILEEGRKYYPEDQDILFLLTNAYIAADKTIVAMDTFKAGVEKDPKNQYFRYNYGTLLLQSGKYEEATEQFLKAIETDAKYASAYYNLAVTYIRWGTALREKADAAGKDDPEYKKKYQDALPLLKKAIELRPDDPLSWETIAKVYAVLGMNKESQDAFNKADQYRPK
jgi:tetratricopeptide (TPR) repeat protein